MGDDVVVPTPAQKIAAYKFAIRAAWKALLYSVELAHACTFGPGAVKIGLKLGWHSVSL